MTVEDPLAAHLISQIQQNVELLASQNYISHGDAQEILARLPQGSATKAPSAMSQISSKFSKLVSPSHSQEAHQPRAVPPPPPPPQRDSAPQAKALWGHNEKGSDPNDLTFSAGDIIEIIDETNADWWRGRFNGKEGLLPSSYVEKLQTPVAAAPAFPTPAPRPYKAFGAAHHGANAPPPAGEGVNSVGLQQAPDNEEKKSKFGGLKNTMAHSAAGGVGFGAGAAIGGGLVRAIF
ncbi:hypothetical protein EST38_g200 [Candolleomyces aberdarensis]|uniref:SH3 domain-containing protein n=1 Tax=Candolleomyces aberdarensis TaxID=2316362 RepID=A0A4Q2E006_9AGAR|nr:hypothetical protein EST38_g200 [Candolleomyces aberdarensis]